MWIKADKDRLINSDGLIGIYLNDEEKTIVYNKYDYNGYTVKEYQTIDEYNTAKTKLQKLLNITEV